jgi:hypothetical protein
LARPRRGLGLCRSSESESRRFCLEDPVPRLDCPPNSENAGSISFLAGVVQDAAGLGGVVSAGGVGECLVEEVAVAFEGDEGLEWPAIVWTSLMSAPAATRRLMQVWRRSWKR